MAEPNEDSRGITDAQKWARERLISVLSWSLGTTLVLAGLAMSNGRKIGFRIQPEDEVELVWISFGDWWKRDEPAAALVWLLAMVVVFGAWKWLVWRLLNQLEGVDHPTLLPEVAVKGFVAAVIALNFVLWTAVSFW